MPQWGGVVFYNPSQEEMNSDPVNVNVKMENVMPVFVKQLKMLLGITSDVSCVWVWVGVVWVRECVCVRACMCVHNSYKSIPTGHVTI